MNVIAEQMAAELLPKLSEDSNKYTRGVCELMVGSFMFPGAAVLAAMAANRMGAGYVKVYTVDSAAEALHVVQPSSVVVPTEDYVHEFHGSEAGHPRAAVVGCGMTSAEDDVKRTLAVLEYAAAPVLVDGSGLYALTMAEGKRLLRDRAEEGLPTVITPHGGEAYRLAMALSHGAGTGMDIASMTPAELALELARDYQSVCVLKGPDTYIATGAEASADEVLLFTEGTPALSKAGTGDVLAGFIGALLSQQLDPVDACALGVYVHALAARLAADDLTEMGVTTEDVLKYVPAALRQLGA